MKSHLFKKIVFLLLITATLTSCGALQPTSRALVPLRVEYTLWWGDYTLLVAKEKGFFADAGVDVEPAYYETFTDSLSDLAAGQIDGALIASGDVMNVNRHTPVKIIGVSDDGGYMPIVARPEINSVNDLRGKAIGTMVGTQYELLVADMLASANMSAADVSVQNINPEAVPAALTRNDVQAAFSWEPFISQAIKNGNHILYPTDNTLRLFPDTIAFSQSVIEQRPKDIQAFMNAWFKAVDYRLNNPEETRQIAAKYIGLPIEKIKADPSLKIFSYEDNVVMYAQAETEANSIYNIAQKTAAYLIANGTLASMPNLNAILTAEFLPKSK